MFTGNFEFLNQFFADQHTSRWNLASDFVCLLQSAGSIKYSRLVAAWNFNIWHLLNIIVKTKSVHGSTVKERPKYSSLVC